jgi:hypothetical protein
MKIGDREVDARWMVQTLAWAAIFLALVCYRYQVVVQNLFDGHFEFVAIAIVFGLGATYLTNRLEALVKRAWSELLVDWRVFRAILRLHDRQEFLREIEKEAELKRHKAIAVGDAVICNECENVTELVDNHCPICGSDSTFPIEKEADQNVRKRSPCKMLCSVVNAR